MKSDGTLTTTGLIVAIILMAILTAVNFLGVKMLAATNSAMTWWKVAIPLLTILVLALFNFHGSNFHAANGFNPNGVHGILLGGRHQRHHLQLPRLRAGRPAGR